MPHPPWPSDTELFKFTFAHLPENAEPAQTPPALKLFGFFDTLALESQAGFSSPKDFEPVPEDRLQRTLFAFGNGAQVRAIERLVRDEKKPAYIAVSLIKLTDPIAHRDFGRFSLEVIARQDADTAYLVCLDAPDVIALRAFGGRASGGKDQPLARLVRWTEDHARTSGFLGGKVERTLTMVACRDPDAFVEDLANQDANSPARALVRLMDMKTGNGIHRLLQSIPDRAFAERLRGELKTSVGYYDSHLLLTIPDAAQLLRHARPLVKNRELTSSTCFLSAPSDEPPVPIAPVEPTLLNDLLAQWEQLDKELELRNKADCLFSTVRLAAKETINRFKRLHTTGLIPGSRLLLWTARDAMATFTRECQWQTVKKQGNSDTAYWRDLDSNFYLRQLSFCGLFRAICDELDRRVSLSLAAHARFFPSSLEVPLKLIAAVDLVGRLTVASFRCFRCRENAGLLQVFTAKADKPSQFQVFPDYSAFASGERPPTIMLTTFSPRMARHFYLAMFMHMHEVAQCTIRDTLLVPSFSALVMAHAHVERLAAISTLSCLGAGARQTTVPEFVYRWAASFLDRELLNESWWEPHHSVEPVYFAQPDTEIPDAHKPETAGEAGGMLWETQFREWQVHHVDASTPEGALECYRLYRDSRLLPYLENSLQEQSFLQIWCQELLSQFGALPEEMAAGRKGVDGLPIDYNAKVSEIRLAAVMWSEAAHPKEYLELASLIPFLRLYEEDPDHQPLVEAIRDLACDFADVWRNSLAPTVAFDIARRYVVALAAMDLLRQHAAKTPIDARTPEADQGIADALTRNAKLLLECLPQMTGGHCHTAFKQVWEYLASGSEIALPPRFEYTLQVAEPLLIRGMVRFLTRMLQVHSMKGENLLPPQRETMSRFNATVREIFDARQNPATERMPLPHLLRLWSMQYPLTENHDYNFPLEKALDLLP